MLLFVVKYSEDQLRWKKGVQKTFFLCESEVVVNMCALMQAEPLYVALVIGTNIFATTNMERPPGRAAPHPLRGVPLENRFKLDLTSFKASIQAWYYIDLILQMASNG